MRKTFKWCIILLFCVPFLIEAKWDNTYDEAIVVANDYIKNFDKYDKYIYFPEYSDYSSYYIFGGGNNSDGFEYGGFISDQEFEITRRNFTSYLASITDYWTHTVPGTQTNNRYIIDFEKKILDTNSTSGVRVTQFVKGETRVTGTGTKSNPFVFVNISKIVINTNDINKGGFSKSNTNCSNVTNKITSYLSTSNETYKLCPALGYKYNASDCGDNISIVDNTISVENKGYDVICNIEFVPN